MMIVMLCGRLFNERSDTLNSLGIAVFIICLNPFAVTDAGALLTVTAVLGLIIIDPMLIGLYKPKTKLVYYVYKTVCASLSCVFNNFTGCLYNLWLCQYALEFFLIFLSFLWHR